MTKPYFDKKSIQRLIERGDIQQARYAVEDYLHTFAIDAEVCSFQAVIAMIDKDWIVAKAHIQQGLALEPDNGDLLYDMGYLNEQAGYMHDAVSFYIQSLTHADNEMLKTALVSRLTYCQRALGNASGENFIVKNTDFSETPRAGENLYETRSNVVKARACIDAPIVSVMVLAYNNLEKYTKPCVESILKYTQDVDYEIILVDNGSSDGTLEYFYSVDYAKKKVIRITKNIGAFEGVRQGLQYCSGVYIATIANDVFVTQRWLSNLVKTLDSDVRIGMVNPVSDNVSNLQAVDLKYKNFSDMQKKAAAFNISNPAKWEERLRLVTNGVVYRKECLETIGGGDYGFFHDFGDDEITFRLRRAGYKAVLCKDTFVCHAGQVIDDGSGTSNKSLEQGRKDFQEKYYGIDAWDDVNNYEPTMVHHLCEIKSRQDLIGVLGVDVRCGTPILEVKNKLKSQKDTSVSLSAFTTNAKYWVDLKSICDGKVVCDRIHYIADGFQDGMFDRILLGEYLNQYENPYKLVRDLLRLLLPEGILSVKVKTEQDLMDFLQLLGHKRPENSNCRYKMDFVELENAIVLSGGKIEKRVEEQYMIDRNNHQQIISLLQRIVSPNEAKEILGSLIVKEVCLKIQKVK